MKVNVNVKRKFKINGKEYDSIEEMPAEIQEAFKKAMSAQSTSGSGITPGMIRNKITFNGVEYESVEAMPQEIRELYEKVLKAAEAGASPSDLDFTVISNNLQKVTKIPGPIFSENLKRDQKFDNFLSRKKLIFIVLLGAFIILAYLLFRSKGF